jgi:hypothetical protein
MAYSYRRTITVDHSKCGSNDSSSFPLLFTGTFTYLKSTGNGGLVQHGSGYDISFYSDSALTTKLNFERVKWVASTGECEFWIRIPTLSHTTDTVVYLAYGDVSIVTDQSNKTAVWDSNFLAVYHLPDGSTLSGTDSTGNAANATINGATATGGKVNGGASFNGSSKYITLPNPDVVTTDRFTVSVWINATSLPAWGTILKNWGDSNPGAFHLGLNASGGNVSNYLTESGGGGVSITDTSAISTGVWYYISTTADGSTLRLYQNGSSVGTPVSYNGTLKSFPYTLVGAKPADGSNVASGIAPGYWDGSMDEVRISKSARSSDWILSEYNNQNDPATFYAIGSQTAIGGGSSIVFGYFNSPVLM